MLFRFGCYALDLERRELHRGEEPVALEPQVFDLLVHLIRNRERVVSKDELIATVWEGRIVSDATIDSRVKAARRDHDDPWAHFAMGCACLHSRRFDDSLARFELALRLNPNFSLARGYYGLALCYDGRWQDGNAAALRALRLSPHDPLAGIYCGIAAYAQFMGRNYAEAIRLARDGIRQRTDFVGAHRVLTAAAAMAGEDAVARSALRELRRVQPGISLAWIARHIPIRLDAEREHYVDAFRRAGME